jgi:thiol-disulfide isomerase/thioredoxin
MKDYLLVLIYANWCGHCKTYKQIDNNGDSEWGRVKKAVKKMFNDVGVYEIESEQIKSFSELKDTYTNSETKELTIPPEDFSAKCNNIVNNKIKEFKEMIKTQNVNREELNYLMDIYNLFNKTDIYDLLSFRGYPTLMIMKNINGIYEKYSMCNAPRDDGNAVCEFIKKCKSGENKQNKIDHLQRGGNKPNYRKKYRKYKTMYANLVEKYIKLKNKY